MAALGALFRHPVARSAGISCLSMAAGDALCQAIRGRQALRQPQQRQGIDWAQTARFATVGATLHGPFFYHTFRWLDARFGQAATLRQAATKVAAGQLTAFPIYVAAFYLYMGLLEQLGQKEGGPPSLQRAVAKLTSAFPATYTAGWGFWVPANLLNFMLVPPGSRVLFVNAAGLLWNAFLSFENSTKGRLGAAAGAAAAPNAAAARKRR